MTLVGNRVGPCPKCEGLGRIPDGVYTSASAHLFNPAECQIVVHALRQLREKVRAGADAAEIENEIQEHYPFLKPLLWLLPKTSTDLVAYLTLIFAVLAYFVERKPNTQLQQIQIEEKLSEALEQVVSALKTSQQNSQDPPPETEQEEEPED